MCLAGGKDYDCVDHRCQAVRYESPVDAVAQQWPTYRNEEYGFEIQYPSSARAGYPAANSVLGTADSPVGGIHVGSLVLVVTQDQALRKRAQEYYDGYRQRAEEPAEAVEEGEMPGIGCDTGTIQTPQRLIEYVECGGEGGYAFYALIKGGDRDIFVDGYSDGYGSGSRETRGELLPENYSTVLSTFRWLR